MKIFLETPRLILRQFTKDDVDNLVTLDSDPDVMRFINGGIASSYEAVAENKASLRVMEKIGLKLQQEYVLTADMLPDASLLENPIIQNLLNQKIVKYQLVR